MRPTLELLRRHATVRDYTPEPMPEEEWLEIVRAAQQASTDATGQMYSLVELRDPGLRSRVAAHVGDQPHIANAARLAILCLDVRRLRLLLEHRGHRLGIRGHAALLFGLTDLGLFAQNLAIAAEALDYGVCFLGSVQNNSRAIARELRLPQGVVPMYGVAIGRPARRTPPKPRTPTQHVLHVDAYRDPTPAQLDGIFAEMAPATRSGDWLNPLRKYFAEDGVMHRRETEIHGLWVDLGLDPCAAVRASRP